MTFLSVPGKSYVEGGNFTFLQIAIGYIMGRFAIIVFLLPGVFSRRNAECVSGAGASVRTDDAAAGVAGISRDAKSGRRLAIVSQRWALNIAIGLDFITCIVVMTIVTAIYSCAGGVQSVVWNDCIQFAVYMAGAIATVWVIVTHLSGGWSQLVEFGQTTDRWQLFDFDPSLTKPSVTFWSGLFGGAFLSLATHGVDQMIVQRYLCAKDRKSRRAGRWD